MCVLYVCMCACQYVCVFYTRVCQYVCVFYTRVCQYVCVFYTRACQYVCVFYTRVCVLLGSLQETAPAAPGLRKRKATILGDTVNSKAIAPMALGTDVLAHEATFSQVGDDT
jgi:hypothetical protein